MSQDMDQSQNSNAEGDDSFTWGDGLTLTVDSEGLSASLEVSLDFGNYYTHDDFDRYLAENKVVSGIDVEAVSSIINESRFNEEIEVARSISPVKGTDGFVDWTVDISVLDGAALIEKQGKVDWKEQHHVLQVEKDQLLAKLVEPTPGKPGTNVYGKVLPAVEGVSVKLPAGKGIRVSEEGTEMYADLNGVVSREGDKYVVSQTFEVKGDVSFESGNVNYEGTVVINGGVLTDFKVTSGQDIHINGLVEGALLDAKGSIFLNGGVQGDQKAKLIAGGDITAKYIHNATVQAMGNIIINSAITQSVVQSHDRVIVEGPKGTIAGGSVYAENEISADVYGAEIGTKTKIVLGHDLKEFKEKIKNNEIKFKSVSDNASKLELALNQINKLRDAGKTTPQHDEMRLKLIRASMQQKGQVKKLQITIDEMQKEMNKAKQKQKGVVVRDIAWSGTTIEIIDEVFYVPKQISKVILAMPGNEIKQYGYKNVDGKETATPKG